MPIPELAVTADDPRGLEVHVLVLGLRAEAGTATPTLPEGLSAAELGLDGVDLAAIGAGTAEGELVRLPAPGIAARSIALVGLGADPGPDALRGAAGTATRRIRGVRSFA